MGRRVCLALTRHYGMKFQKYVFPPLGGLFLASIVAFDRVHTCRNRREAEEEWRQVKLKLVLNYKYSN